MAHPTSRHRHALREQAKRRTHHLGRYLPDFMWTAAVQTISNELLQHSVHVEHTNFGGSTNACTTRILCKQSWTIIHTSRSARFWLYQRSSARAPHWWVCLAERCGRKASGKDLHFSAVLISRTTYLFNVVHNNRSYRKHCHNISLVGRRLYGNGANM